jgi:hypothetical protein
VTKSGKLVISVLAAAAMLVGALPMAARFRPRVDLGGRPGRWINGTGMEERIGQSFGQISEDGVFPSGIKVVNVIRFIADRDYGADLDEVAGHFDLSPEEVAAAISFHACNYEWLQPLVESAKA